MKRVKKMVKWFFTGVLAVIVLTIIIVIIMQIINANKYKINTKNGIQESTYIDIGGIKQYIQIRGEDVNNPVILWLHGGPGFPLSYLSYYYQSPLESDYTIVCWEQRGCGRTYFKNSTNDLSIDLILEDTDDIVNYLLDRFDQEKIIIMGQSWGTVIGSTYVNNNPEKVSAYIGVGQVIDFDEGKIHAAEVAKGIAKEKGNTEDEKALESYISNFSKSTSVENLDLKNLDNMILSSLKYFDSSGQMTGLNQMWAGITSPFMNIDDCRWFLNASSTEKIFNLEKPLINYMYYEFDIKNLNNNYQVPVCYIQGDNDWITPTDMVAQYYEEVEAPDKKMIVVEKAGHTPFLDHPTEFSAAVLGFLKSLK